MEISYEKKRTFLFKKLEKKRKKSPEVEKNKRKP